LKPPAWFPSGGFLAQEVHFAFGLAFVLGAKALGFSPGLGAAVILLVDFTKEATFDEWVEKEPLFYNGLIDWLFYVIGAAVAAGLLLLRFGPPGLVAAP
jgi:hypothetical protein